MLTMEDVVAEPVLTQAFAWLCRQRRDYPPTADVWAFRRHWPEAREPLRAALLAGEYEISLLTRVTNARGEECDLWAARDALVLKALALVLSDRVPAAPSCSHRAGHGGAKGAGRTVWEPLPRHRCVLKTAVQGLQASIEPQRLLERLAVGIAARRVLHLCGQSLRRTTERGGHYGEPRCGMALGCPLSPVIGALLLAELEATLVQHGLKVVRFMDDILVLAPTRWQLRAAVRLVHQGLAALGLRTHPPKTCIGRIARGSTLLGYHLSPSGITVARQTVERMVARAPAV